MLLWWSEIKAVALANDWLLAATIVSSLITVVLAFLTVKSYKNHIQRLSADLESSNKQVKTLEKTAEEIRRELLQTQQHQDINQLKLKTSKSSAQELHQALLDAKKRLKAAEEALKEQEEKDAGKKTDEGVADTNKQSPGTLEDFDLEYEIEGNLSDNRREQLIDLLDPGPKGNVDIFCILDDKTSEMTAEQLESILAADGWKTSSVAKSVFTNPPEGIVLAVNSKDTAPSYASFLQRVFTTIGWKVSASIDSKYREWSLTIIVGSMDD